MDRLRKGARLGGITCLAVAALVQDVPSAKPESILFEALPVVEAASLHSQTLLEAPASVTVITDEDIRRRGYRTMADVLADVRGMYVSYDRAYYYVGVRGFSIPGDANNRFLMMINGHSLIENVQGSANSFGQDFGLDLDLVKRIEIVRGPSSALYGTNGMFATINIVTKSPVEYEPLRVSAEVDNFGERKVQVSGEQYLGRGFNLLLSASVFYNSGQSPLYFPQFDTPQTNHGLAVNMDGAQGYHTFANLIWRGWSFLAYFNNSQKIVPTGSYGTLFNDRGDKFSTGRDFLESRYQRDIGAEGKLTWRVYYDRFRFAGRYDIGSPFGTLDARNVSDGDWMGSELTYRFQAPLVGFLTLGGQANWDLQSRTESYFVSPVSQILARVNNPDRSLAVFFQDEWALSKHFTLYLGGRADDSGKHQLMLTPRVALIYQPSESSAVKLLYGRSFRNPSPFEQYYGDGFTQIANLALDSERLRTFEVAFEKRVSQQIELLANVYQYRLGDLIQAQLIGDRLQQFRNLYSSRATGFELEAVATLRAGLKLDASLAVQSASAEPGAFVKVNSPGGVGKLLLDSPVWRNRWSVSGGIQYLSERVTIPGGTVPPVYLVNLAAQSRRLPGDMELQAGICNLFNYRYWDPAGRVLDSDRIQQDGRSFFLRLSWAPHPAMDAARRKAAARASGGFRS